MIRRDCRPHDVKRRKCPDCGRIRMVGTYFISVPDGPPGSDLWDEMNYVSCYKCYLEAQQKSLDEG